MKKPMTVYTESKNRKSLIYASSAILFLFFITLVSLPSLQAGFYYDDVLNSQLRGYAQTYNLNLFDLMKATIKGWMQAGRLFPLAIIVSFPLYYFFNTPISYHIIQVFFIWLSLFSVAYLIKLVTKQLPSVALFLLLAPAFWSIRDSHDPLMSYGLLLPSTTLFIILALICFIKYLETQNRWWQVAALFVYSCALLTYEVGILTFPAMLLLLFFYPSYNHRKLIPILPHFILTLMYIFICIFVRFQNSHIYDGIGIGSWTLFPRTFFIQLSATLPLSYWLLKASPQAIIAILLDRDVFDYLSAGFIFLLSFCGSFYLLKRIFLSSKQKWLLNLLGLLFMVVPAIFVAGSGKYQAWLTWGIGYLPIYLQYIGITLMCVTLVTTVKPLFWRSFCILLLSALTSLAFLLNTFIVQAKNEVFLKPRSLVEQALQHGVLNAVPASSILVVKDDLWSTPQFYLQNSGVHAELEKIGLESISEIKKQKYYLTYKREIGKIKGEVVITNANFKVIARYQV